MLLHYQRNFLLGVFLLSPLLLFGQKKKYCTKDFKKMEGDVIIKYKMIFEDDISEISKKDPHFVDERIIYFNSSTLVSKLSYTDVRAQYMERLTYMDFLSERTYYLNSYRNKNKGDGFYVRFNDPYKKAVRVEGNEKYIAGYECKKYEVIVHGEKKYMYTTEAFGLKYTQNYITEGIEFCMELPRYSKKYGHYRLVADEVTFTTLSKTVYDLDFYDILPKEEYMIERKSIKNKSLIVQNHANEKLIGSKAPTFKSTTIDHNTVNSKSYNGKVVVYNFWSLKNKGSVQEVMKLNELYEKYKNNPNVVFLSLALDKEVALQEFNNLYNFKYQIVDNAGEYINKFKVSLYPTNVVVDKNGNYINYTVGYKKDIVDRLSSSIELALHPESVNNDITNHKVKPKENQLLK
ncbi:redoxin domain-containing protein [Flammeovirga sp. SubArs3]|uniref:TlpA family protein disulfide reductase n=1 Tax=Flammeovirga sp. SubArs3 TaxID=2995316 RepID=UPI00248CD4FC|nr:redoxin domain-containing protein [Flammeovirga sp. SubArs3]